MTDSLTDRERALCREACLTLLDEVGIRSAWTPVVDRLYPAPAPEPQTVTTSGPTYRVLNGVLQVEIKELGGRSLGWRATAITVADVRALASLLPKREPTDEIVEKAREAFWGSVLDDDQSDEMRAALLAVWDDIAAPAAPVPKPQWWGVVDRKGRLYPASDREEAQRRVASWDTLALNGAPYRVIALAEVPHAP